MKEETKFTEYIITQKYGMEGIGDMEMEWLTPKEQEDRWEEYRNYVEQTKKDGTYGKEYQTKISMVHDSLLDQEIKSEKPLISFSTIIWDVNDIQE